MWLTIPHKCVQFFDPRLNLSEEIRRKNRLFFFHDNFRPELVVDAVSGAGVDPTGVKVLVIFSDSW